MSTFVKPYTSLYEKRQSTFQLATMIAECGPWESHRQRLYIKQYENNIVGCKYISPLSFLWATPKKRTEHELLACLLKLLLDL